MVFAVVLLTKTLDGDDDDTGACGGRDGDNLILKLSTRIFCFALLLGKTFNAGVCVSFLRFVSFGLWLRFILL